MLVITSQMAHLTDRQEYIRAIFRDNPFDAIFMTPQDDCTRLRRTVDRFILVRNWVDSQSRPDIKHPHLIISSSRRSDMRSKSRRKSKI